MDIVLVHPQIPHNTGCAARLAAALQLPLHLVEPLGFSLEDKYLKRAGLDYWPKVALHVHPEPTMRAPCVHHEHTMCRHVRAMPAPCAHTSCVSAEGLRDLNVNAKML